MGRVRLLVGVRLRVRVRVRVRPPATALPAALATLPTKGVASLPASALAAAAVAKPLPG